MLTRMSESEFVTVRMSSELLARMVAGWSEPVQVKIEPAPGAEPPWTMTCRKPQVKAFLVGGILADGGEITFPPEDVRAVYTDDVTERPAEQPEYEVKMMSCGNADVPEKLPERAHG